MVTVRKKDGSDDESSWADIIDMKQTGGQFCVKLKDGSEGRVVWKDELAKERHQAELEAKLEAEDNVRRESFKQEFERLFGPIEDEDSDKRKGVQRLFEDFNKPNDLK